MLRMDIDEVINTLCPFGYHQKKIFWTIALSMIFTACQQVHNVFLAAEPSFTCMRDGQEVPGVGKCGEGQAGGQAEGATCDSYQFKGDDFTSIVSEWELVCERSYLANLVQSVFMGGILTGSLVFGYLADHYGRRTTTYLSLAGMGLFSALGACAGSFRIYVLIRLAVGVCCGGWGLVSFVLTTELLGATRRGMVAMVMPIVFAIGIIILSGLAYLVPAWRTLTLITSLPGLAAGYLYLITPESPRWLASQGRVREAEQTLDRIITLNTGSPPKEAINLKTNTAQEKGTGADSILDIIRHRELLKRSLINIILWFVNCAAYYGLTMGAGSLGGNMYVSVALSGLVELPAYALGLFMINRFGRRMSVISTMVCGGVACLMILMIPADSFVESTVAAMLGKMCISVSFSVVWCYTAELYPTSIRNQAMSICNMSARLGGVVSPMLMQLSHTYPSLDFFVFGALSVCAGLLTARLPETLNTHLPETVADLSSGSGSLAKVKVIPESKVRLLEKEILAANEDSDYEMT